MNLSNKQIKDFQELYKKFFKEEISKDEAYLKGMRLIRLMQIIINNKNKKNGKTK